MKENPGKTAFIGLRVPQVIADRLTAYCQEKKTTASEVVRGLLEAALLTPDERLESLKAAQAAFEAGVEELRQRMEAKIESASGPLYVKGLGEEPTGPWLRVRKGPKGK